MQIRALASTDIVTVGELLCQPRLDESSCYQTAYLRVPNAHLKFSSFYLSFNLFRTGELDGAQGWTAQSAQTHDATPWMKMDMLQVLPVAGVVTQGRRKQNYTGPYGVYDQWVTRYRVK